MPDFEDKDEQEGLLWKKIITFLVWLGAILCLTFSLIIGVMVYGWIDDWEGNVEDSLIPFVVSVVVVTLMIFPIAHLYGKYCIHPFEQMEESRSP